MVSLGIVYYNMGIIVILILNIDLRIFDLDGTYEVSKTTIEHDTTLNVEEPKVL